MITHIQELPSSSSGSELVAPSAPPAAGSAEAPAAAGSGVESTQSRIASMSSFLRSGKADIAVGDHLETSAA